MSVVQNKSEEETKLLGSSYDDDYSSDGFTATTGYQKDYQTWLKDKHAKEKLDKRTRWFVYISHFLSSWGDRMWSFGVGLFMVELEPQSLRLVAVYGFANGGAILLLGAIVGDWVDKTARLSAARWTLVIQNLSVFVCSVIVFFVFQYYTEIKMLWPNEGFADLSYAVIMILAIIGNLASEGRKIAVERDWIVEICGRDKDLLASMTSTLRAIDLTTLILAPIATGQIIGFTVIGYGALFIAGWNLVSVIVEYFLIWKVYEEVPALRAVKNKSRKVGEDSPTPAEKETPLMDGEVEITVNESPNGDSGQQPLGKHSHESDDKECINKTDAEIESVNKEDSDTSCRGKCGECFGKVFSSFITLHRGWTTYIKYDVAFAGLGLAMLYMTVLGFDNITVGFAYSQGVSESILGVLMAAGALVGILGTFAYPLIRRRFGLERTGLFGLGSEILLLCPCVASVWAPGSPFDLLYASRAPSGEIIPEYCGNNSVLLSNQTTNSSVDLNSSFINQTVLCNSTNKVLGTEPDISVWLLMGGIIGARFGLWVADLTITQLFLQSVVEQERGIMNGVQSSLNQFADMLKFLMVIFAPDPEVFGVLILISFAFVCLGWVFYAKYTRSSRGHFFHFEKFTKCLDAENNNQTRPNSSTREIEATSNTS